MASYVSDLVKKVWVSSSSSCPISGYKLENNCDEFDTDLYVIKNVVKSSNKLEKTSLFSLKLSNFIALAAADVKFLKSLRHPTVVKFHDSIQKQDQLHVITERVYPIKYRTEVISFVELVMGFYSILKFMSFLHSSCKLVHCMINENSIFVNDAGEFRVGGFIFCVPYSSNLSDHLRDINNSPLNQNQSDQLMNFTNNPQSVDALLVCEFFQTLLTQIPGALPEPKNEFISALRKLSADAKKQKFDFSVYIEWFVQNAAYNSKFIYVNTFFDEYFAKTREEKDIFLTDFVDHLNVFPQSYLKHKILNLLLTAIDTNWTRKEFISCEIYLFLQIATLLESAEYESKALPTIVKLFQLQDRGIRMLLLKNINEHCELIPKKTLGDPIYNLIVTFCLLIM